MTAPWTADLRSLVKDKQIKQILERAQERDVWVGRQTGNGHVRLRHVPSGHQVTVPSTTGYRRSLANMQALIRAVEEGRDGRGRTAAAVRSRLPGRAGHTDPPRGGHPGL